MHPVATPVVAVLAGGAGRRLGAAKAGVALAGRPLISYPIAAADGAGLQTVVVAKSDTPLPRLDVEVWAEPREPRHPLRGLVTALERANGAPVLALGCDLPFVTAELLGWLARQHGRAAVPRVGGRLQPLLARYDPCALEPFAAALPSERPLQEVVATLGPRTVDEAQLRRFGPPARLAFNVNTPDDLARAERLLAA
jgi:molybdopterin-guanine dinucleotide biosynthesis protein A